VNRAVSQKVISFISLCVVVLLSACGGNSSEQNPGVRNLRPTLVAPAYIQSAAPITAENIASVQLLGRLDQPETPSTLFAHTISPDGTRLVALNNEEILAWDLLSGELVFRTARLNAVNAFYSPDKTEIYTVSPSGRVVAYDADTGAERSAMQVHDRYNNLLAYDAPTGRAAFAGEDGAIRVWDLLERQALVEINAHSGSITVLAFSNDGTLLASAGLDGIARLWNWQTRTQLGELNLENLLVYRMQFSPDDAQVALGSQSDVRLWSTVDASLTRRLAAPTGGVQQVLLYAPSGRYLAVGNPTGGLQIWNPVSMLETGLIELTGAQLSADFAPEGDLLVASTLGEGGAVFNLPEAENGQVPRGELSLPGSAIFAVEWTDDSRLILLFDASGQVYVMGVGESAA